MVVTATGNTAMPPLLHLYFFALLLLCSFQFSRHQSIPQSITYSLEEEAPVDTLVGKVSGDSGIKEVLGEEALASLRYSLLSKGNQYSGLFQISSTGGFLTVAGRIDRETLCPFSDSCQLSLEVAVQSSDGFFKNVKVEVVIRDKNDNSPTFPRQSMTLNVSEAVSRGFTLSLEPASDKDASENYSVQSYMLEPQSAPFTIVQSHNLVGIPQLSLVVSGPLDREVMPVYNLTVWAYDGGQPPRAGAMTVSVLVLDVNDNAPTFTKAVYSVNVSESAPEGTAILTVSATDLDDGDNAALQYTISMQQPASERQKLRVGAKDGVVTLAKALNVGVHRVLVEVQDGGSPPMAAQAVVQVTVLDTDNNPPALNVDLLSVLDMKPGFVPERAKVSTAVAYMAVSDPDTNANGIVTCSCHSDRFDLQPLDLNEYKVIINMPLDREEEDHYTVLITCADGGSPRLSASATFDIWVVDANDNAPAFLQKDHFVSVAENNSPSDGLIQVAATDADSGDNANVTYSLLGAEGNFQIGAQNGLVKVIHKFNYEQRSRYVFYVLATDHGDPPLTSTATVTVNVLDVNDEVPTFSAQEYVMSVDESVKPGTYIGNVSAFDPDTGPGGQVVLSIVQSLGSDFPIPFAIRNTGVIVTTGPLDREQRGSYVLYVMAKDQGSQPLSSTALVRIDILDINDNPPQFVFPENGSNTYTLPIPVQANFIVGTVRAVDPDSGLNSVVSYSTVGGNSSYFRVDEFTGSLITARDMDEAQVGSYYLLVRATDKGSPPLSSEQKISLYVTRHVSGELTGDDDRYIVIVIVIVVFTVVVAAGVFTTLCVLRKLDQDRKLKYRAACCPDTDAGGQLEMAGTQCPADNQQVGQGSHVCPCMRGVSTSRDCVGERKRGRLDADLSSWMSRKEKKKEIILCADSFCVSGKGWGAILK